MLDNERRNSQTSGKEMKWENMCFTSSLAQGITGGWIIAGNTPISGLPV